MNKSIRPRSIEFRGKQLTLNTFWKSVFPSSTNFAPNQKHKAYAANMTRFEMPKMSPLKNP